MKYKLTDQDGCTRSDYKNQTKWTVGETVTAKGDGTELCTDSVVHYYDSPKLAILLNGIHANINNPRIFEVEGECVAHDGLKGGAKSLTVIREIEPPVLTKEIIVKFAILCTMLLPKTSNFTTWANNWLSGKDRSSDSALIIKREASELSDIRRGTRIALISSSVKDTANTAIAFTDCRPLVILSIYAGNAASYVARAMRSIDSSIFLDMAEKAFEENKESGF